MPASTASATGRRGTTVEDREFPFPTPLGGAQEDVGGRPLARCRTIGPPATARREGGDRDGVGWESLAFATGTLVGSP
jgi:hypothetical protein